MLYVVSFATYSHPSSLLLEIAKKLYEKHKEYYINYTQPIYLLPSELPDLSQLLDKPTFVMFSNFALFDRWTGYQQVVLDPTGKLFMDDLEPTFRADVPLQLWRWTTAGGNTFAIGHVNSIPHILWYGRRHAICEHFPTLNMLLENQGYVLDEFYFTRRPDLNPFTTSTQEMPETCNHEEKHSLPEQQSEQHKKDWPFSTSFTDNIKNERKLK